MALTVLQIINIAKISQYLCVNDIQKSGLYGGGTDLQLPNKLYNIRKGIEYQYDLDSTNTDLPATAAYLYALCGKYGIYAQNITGSGGSISPITPINAPIPYQFTVAASGTLIINGQSSVIVTSFIGFNLLFVRNEIPQGTIDLGGTYYSWDRDEARLTISPAAIVTEHFFFMPIG